MQACTTSDGNLSQARSNIYKRTTIREILENPAKIHGFPAFATSESWIFSTPLFQATISFELETGVLLLPSECRRGRRCFSAPHNEERCGVPAMIRRCDETCHKQRAVMACITVMRCSEAAGHPMSGERPEKYKDTTNFRIKWTSSSKFTSHPRLIQYFELQTIDTMKSSSVLASFTLFFASVMAQTACAPAASAIPTCGV
jgi:hypothetical protein